MIPGKDIPFDLRNRKNASNVPAAANGLPSGGTAGQILSKIDATDYNAQWIANAAVQKGDGLFVQIRNNTGSTLTKGQIVYTTGATGAKVTVALALATSDSTSARTLGWVENDILVNDLGWVQIEGYLSGIDTASVTDGSQLYLSGTTAGAWQSTKPVAPVHLVYVGVVAKAASAAGGGAVLVKVQNGYELDEIHDALITSKANLDVLSWDSASGLWKNKTLANAGIAASGHVHGNITNGGAITTSATPGSAPKFIIADSTTNILGTWTPTGTASSTTYLRGDGSWVTPPGTYTLPTATSTALGGVQLFDNTVQTVAASAVSSTASRTYGLQLNSASQGVINVPWTDTTYTLSSGTNNGTLKLTPSSGSVQDNIAVTGLGTAAYTASSAYATSTHVHGNVLNGGTMTTSVTATNPVKMVITDATNNIGLLTTTGASSSTFLRGDGTWITPTGFANPMTTAGDVIYGGASGAPTRLAGSGTNGWVLTYDTATNAPKWAAAGSGSLGWLGTTQTTASSGGTSTLAGVNTMTPTSSGFSLQPSSSTSQASISITGGTNTSTLIGATGGNITLTGGTSGSGTATTQVGGGVNIYGGTAGTTNTSGQGGAVTLRGGSGLSTHGSVVIGDTSTAAVTIGASGITTTVNGTLLPSYILTSTTANGNEYGSSNQIMTYSGIGTSTTGAPIMMTCASASTRYHVGFSISGTRVGGITTSGTSTAYATSSDYRLKENIQPVPNAIDRLLQLKPIRFTWIQHPELPAVDGFLAHEAQEVVPESVTGVKDEIDEDGKPAYQGIDQSKLIPLLTAALQESIKNSQRLEQKVAELENRITILEGGN